MSVKMQEHANSWPQLKIVLMTLMMKILSEMDEYFYECVGFKVTDSLLSNVSFDKNGR